MHTLPSSSSPTSLHSGMHDDGSTSRNSLWMGDLEPWMDEAYLRQLWYTLGHSVSVKLVRSKSTGQPAGYCFVDFPSPQAAQHAMEHINGQLITGTNTYFRLNWSSGGYTTGMRFDPGPEFSLFIGNLGREVNDYLLFTTFYPRFSNCKSAKVVTDPQTGNSKGFGFVRFGDEAECHRALVEMNGQFCGLNPMRLDLATPRTRTAGGSLAGGFADMLIPQQQYGQSPALHLQIQQQQQLQLQVQHQGHQSGASSSMSPPPADGYDPATDPLNTKVFVGGLAAHVTEDELRSHFMPYGEIVYAKIPPGKGCGFVHYAHRAQAEAAISHLNGTLLGGYPIRLTWARSAGSEKQHRPATSSATTSTSSSASHGSPVSFDYSFLRSNALPAATSAHKLPPYPLISSNSLGSLPIGRPVPKLTATMSDPMFELELLREKQHMWEERSDGLEMLRKQQQQQHMLNRFDDGLWRFSSGGSLSSSSASSISSSSSDAATSTSALRPACFPALLL